MKSFQDYLNEVGEWNPANQQAGAQPEQPGADVEIQNLWKVLGARYGKADIAVSNLMHDEIANFKKRHGENLGMFIWTVLKAWTGQGGQRVTQAGLGKTLEPAQP
jgi:hypothetical protein